MTSVCAPERPVRNYAETAVYVSLYRVARRMVGAARVRVIYYCTGLTLERSRLAALRRAMGEYRISSYYIYGVGGGIYHSVERDRSLYIFETNAVSRRTQAAILRPAGTEIIALRPQLRRRGGRLQLRELPVCRGVMDRVVGYAEPYDAVVLAGFGEHGRDGVQELIDQPVVEICEASAHVAMMIGRAYAVVTTLQRSVPAIEDRLRLPSCRTGAHWCARPA